MPSNDQFFWGGKKGIRALRHEHSTNNPTVQQMQTPEYVQVQVQRDKESEGLLYRVGRMRREEGAKGNEGRQTRDMARQHSQLTLAAHEGKFAKGHSLVNCTGP